MLQALRNHAGSWFIKLLFAFLVLSFCFWGIGDVLRNYSHTRPLLTVGGFAVSLEEFARKFKQTKSEVQRAMHNTAPEADIQKQLQLMNLENKILEQFTIQGLLHQEVQATQLLIADEILKASLRSIPTFHDKKHNFNPEYFRKVLQYNNVTEAKFINDLRMSLLQNQLIQPLSKAQYLPKSYVKTLFQGINQSYSFNVVEIPFDKLPLPSAPDDAVLKAFYEKNRDQFLQPEVREISLLILDSEQLKKTLPLSEEVLHTEYEQRINDFTIPEKRAIKELIFSNEYADMAFEKLEKGQPVFSVANEFRAEQRDVVEVTRGELTPDVAEAVFADRPVPFVTKPLKTSLGTQIIVVSRVQPQAIKPFAEVQAELVVSLRENLANEKYKDLYTIVEDNIAGGSSLKDIAQESGLQFVSAISITSQGQVNKGEFPEYWNQDMKQKAIEIALTTLEGADSPLTEITSGGSSFIVHVDKVILAHVPNFPDIRSKVASEWQQYERRKAAEGMASNLAKAKSSQEFEQQAKSAGFKVQKLEVSRAIIERDATKRQHFTESLWRDMFALNLGKATVGPNKNGIAVVRLNALKPYDIKNSQKYYETFEKLLQRNVGKDIEESFIKGLRSSYSVWVNESMLNTFKASVLGE